MRQITEATGRARFFGNSEVADIDVRDRQIVGVVNEGESRHIACEQAVVWTNILAPVMAYETGTSMPLFPGEHQYVSTDTVPTLDDLEVSEVGMPITAFDGLSLSFRQRFRAHSRLLDGRRPLDVLAEDDFDAVRRAAAAFADGTYV